MSAGLFTYAFGNTVYDLSSRTYIMGVLNVTPDSFSDGGKFLDCDLAVEYALRMIDDGADIIDVGGESTRPKSRAYGDGAETVSAEEELRRVLPVILTLAKRTNIPISVDTTKAEVAQKALAAGATIVNDISGFSFDGMMAKVVAQAGASVILMHIKGTPKTMQLSPTYEDLFAEILDSLRERTQLAQQQGIRQIIIDPGIGFGKSQQHNLQILREFHRFKSLGYPVLAGVSRKTFIGNILSLPVEERIEGSIVAAVIAAANGANILRVHDVKATKRSLTVADAIWKVT